MQWLAPGGSIITLVKPHYEVGGDEKKTMLKNGVLSDDDAATIVDGTAASMADLGLSILGRTWSPIRGSKSSRKGRSGNREALLHVRPDGA